MVDPLVTQRASVSRFVKAGKRVGYSLWLIAIVLFFILFSTNFDGPLVTVVVITLIVGSVILLPSIVMGYAVRAAEREDRQRQSAD
jgi:energy-converting hydrogenase Eha subunit G